MCTIFLLKTTDQILWSAYTEKMVKRTDLCDHAKERIKGGFTDRKKPNEKAKVRKTDHSSKMSKTVLGNPCPPKGSRLFIGVPY